MNEAMFQAIFDKLQDFLPSAWEEVVFFVAYTPGSYSMKYYVKDNSVFTDCFNLPNVNRGQLAKLFIAINKDIAPVRKSLSEQAVWNVMTMTVDRQGKMKSHFDYTDISENSIAYIRNWEEKLLAGTND